MHSKKQAFIPEIVDNNYLDEMSFEEIFGHYFAMEFIVLLVNGDINSNINVKKYYRLINKSLIINIINI